MKKKNLWKLSLCVMAAVSFTACSDDDENETPSYAYNYEAYVASAGNWNANDGTVGGIAINAETGEKVYHNIYQTANGRGIGDAQDILPFKGDIYVVSTTSSKVEVLNSSGVMKEQLLLPGIEPRYLATDGEKVYFSAYSGKVYELGQKDGKLALTDSVTVGDHPEALSVANKKLYVNISGYGAENKVAVVDLATFKKTKDLTVEYNPYNQSVSTGDAVYVVSLSKYNYATYSYEKDPIVQRIDAATDQVTEVCNASAIAYQQSTNSLICLYAPYGASEPYIFTRNLASGKETKWTFASNKNPVSPQQVNCDKNGNVYLIDNPSYTAPSELYLYSPSGALIQSRLQIGYSAQNIRFAE